MNDVDYAEDKLISLDQAGEGFAAGCHLLQSRYHLPDEAAFLIAAAVVATAIGPTARIRNPLGADLPLSLDLTFRAGTQSQVPAAVSDAFRYFREVVGSKVVWRESVGSRRLRADFLATLTALEGVEGLLRHATPVSTPPPFLPMSTPDPDEILRRTNLERETRLVQRDGLRTELAERRMDLAPFLVGENPGWDTVLALDKLAFDHCFTSISSDGAALRELLASTPRQLGKIARLVQASRRGHSLTDGSTVLLHPVLISVHVAAPELLAAAVKSRGLREGGFLQGIILEVPESTAAFAASAFLDTADEQRWVEFLNKLFARRIRGDPQLYMLDERGFNILEDFRQWCQRAGSEHPELADLVGDWPSFVLKLALCVHLAVGKGEEDTLDLVTLGTMTTLIKSVGAKQLLLLERLGRPRAPLAIDADEVSGMVQSSQAWAVPPRCGTYSAATMGRTTPSSPRSWNVQSPPATSSVSANVYA